ncbi:serine--tRNA synthetase-like protein Slimp [Neodiprion fabricii]|uniref:serine--tRNA synthetase-like protein Slimp n=1 Tax=Neodiprion fabricii TaxID=2872261 RepID=UPI001ED97BDC|nr:serine--tRNA synthetase-like protein Slimp [Neodiprion fabricii]
MANVGTRLLSMKHVFFLGRLSLNLNVRTYVSALFVSGKRASESFAILSPYLDFDERFSDMDKLKNELKLRALDVDAESVKNSWDLYKSVISNRDALEQKRIDTASQIKGLNTSNAESVDNEEITRLKTVGKVLREDLKVVREILWELEDSVIPKILKLPNVLHKDTPAFDPVILYSYGNLNPGENSSCSSSHIDIGRRLGLLEYSSPMNYYLHNEAALFELAVLRLAADEFVHDNTMRVTGLDFARSIIVEATGLDHESPEDSFILQDNEEVEKHSVNRMHLIGGASLPSFLAMHTKQLINPKYFPLRYFASGRQYVPFNSRLREAGMFTVCQSSVAEVFAMVKDSKSSEYAEEFERILDSAKLLYNSLCNHYRIVVRPARDLRPWESLRVSFELWSPYSNDYIEVGHLSLCGEYLSKRLLISCQTHYGRTFPSIISGTILSVPRLLGCLLEESPEEFVVPDKVRKYMPA